MQFQGKAFVISAPSGTGKTTLNRRLVQENKNLEFTVSYTDRLKREGEVDGRDYHYITEKEFQQRVERNEMLEWAEVHGVLKGTSIEELKRIKREGKIPLLEIDVQGWKNARSMLENAVSIFIFPPTAESLWKRLEKRGTDSLEDRWRRLIIAKKEIEDAIHYHHFIVNNDLETAYQDLKGIVIDGKSPSMSVAEGKAHCQKLLQEFKTAKWFLDLKKQMG